MWCGGYDLFALTLPACNNWLSASLWRFDFYASLGSIKRFGSVEMA